MVEIDIPQSLFEEEGRQMYGAKLLQIQVRMNYINFMIETYVVK